MKETKRWAKAIKERLPEETNRMVRLTKRVTAETRRPVKQMMAETRRPGKRMTSETSKSAKQVTAETKRPAMWVMIEWMIEWVLAESRKTSK